jgi:SAM-dependent methyltransferase
MRLRKVQRAATSGRLLDVGCGKGSFLSYCTRQGWDAWGVEPSDNGRAMAKKRLGHRVVATPDELAHAGFDVVTLWHVLEHVDDPNSMLRELRRLIRPGGYILVCVPNIDSLQSRLGGAAWSHLDLPRHRVHFDSRTLCEALTRADYEVRWVDHFLPEFGVLGIVQTALNVLGCEPGFLYKLIKRDIHLDGPVSCLRFIYSVSLIIALLSVLLVPVLLLYIGESATHHGGAMIACATPIQEGRSQ